VHDLKLTEVDAFWSFVKRSVAALEKVRSKGWAYVGNA